MVKSNLKQFLLFPKLIDQQLSALWPMSVKKVVPTPTFPLYEDIPRNETDMTETQRISKPPRPRQ